jgi:uridine nucleosidase
LDGTDLIPEATSPPVRDVSAIVAMRAALLAQPEGTAWLVATGTLTNIALLFALFPDLVGHIKGVSIMGGAIGGGFSDVPIGIADGEGERVGNWTRWAEFNIYVCRNRSCISCPAWRIVSNPTPSVTQKPLKPFSRTED